MSAPTLRAVATFAVAGAVAWMVSVAGESLAHAQASPATPQGEPRGAPATPRGEPAPRGAPATPQGEPAAPRGARGEPAALPAVREWKLGNGLTVAHVERPGLPMVAVQVWYRFGSADEPAGQRGAARAFERLMFLGSERLRSEDHRRYIEEVGGETGAMATEDSTAFHDAVPVERFELALELEAERMRHLLVRVAALDAIRPLMLDEVRRQESSPVFAAYQRLLSLIFGAHPYARSPVGATADLQKLTASQVKALYDAYYVPSNALLVVVGGVPADQVQKSVERWFGPLPAAPQPPHPGRSSAGRPDPGKPDSGRSDARPASSGAASASAAAPTAIRREEIPGGALGLIMAGYRLPPAGDADILALQLAGAVLSNGAPSRLHRRLIDGKLADEIGGQVLVRQDGGLLVAFARFAGAPAAVEKAFITELDRLAKQGPSAAELRRAKGQLLAAAWLGMESATGLANQMGASWTLTGAPAGFLADLTRLEKIGAADVRRATIKYLAHEQLSLVVAAPSAAGSAGGAP